jgi:hypothetical protein
MPKYVRIVDNVVQEIVECEDISAWYHPDCGFRAVSDFANEPTLWDIYDPESNSFAPEPERGSDPPVTITVTELGGATNA